MHCVLGHELICVYIVVVYFSKASEAHFHTLYPVGYDPPVAGQNGDGMPTMRWSERRNVKRSGSAFR